MEETKRLIWGDLIMKNDVALLQKYLAEGGKVNELMGVHDLPFYLYAPVVKDLNLLTTLFERKMVIDTEHNFFSRGEMSDDVFRWAIDNDLDKLDYRIPVVHLVHAHRERLSEVLQRGADLYAECSPDRRTALDCAVKYGPESIQNLIEAGFDVNYYTTHTALHTAAYYENTLRAMKMLIELGADPSIKDHKGRDSMMILCDGYRDWDDQTLEKMEYVNSICPNWQLEKDAEGNTALHIAASKDAYRRFPILLDWGSDEWVQNDNGNTPVDILMSNDNVFLFEPLFRHWEKNGKIPWDFLFSKCKAMQLYNIERFLVENIVDNLSIIDK
jgi:ankyrin repeat protein